MLEFGTIVEINEGKALAKVNVLGRITDFLPFISQANAFKKHFIPPQQNEQVAVLDDVLILGSIFNNTCKEPASDEDKEVIVYKDNTKISYDVASKELTIDASNKITIKCNSINVTCTTSTIKANSVIVDSASIDLGKNGKGVVTGECICPFTGMPHADISANTRSAK